MISFASPMRTPSRRMPAGTPTGPTPQATSLPYRSRAKPGTDPAHAEDLALVQGVLAGSLPAISRFAERMRCVPQILASKNRRMGCVFTPEDLADLGQEVFLQLWNRLDAYGGLSSIEAWAGSFCLYGYMNAYHQNRRRPRLVSFELELHGPEARDGATELDLAPLERALEALESHVARVIRMRQCEGLSFVSIAHRQALPVGTVKSLYYRGLLRMRALLGAGAL